MLSKSDASRNPCLVPELIEEVFSFPLVSMILAAFHRFSLLSVFLVFERFDHKYVLDFIKCFFWTKQYDDIIFLLYYIDTVD